MSSLENEVFHPTWAVKPLLHWIRAHVYRNLPTVLYDRYLWLYSDLEELQHCFVYGKHPGDVALYQSLTADGTVSGVGLAKVGEESVSVLVETESDDGLSALLHELSAKYADAEIEFTVRRRDLAERIAAIVGGDVTAGTVKYFASESDGTPILPVQEMLADDEPLLDTTPSRRWQSYPMFLQTGTRFFGLSLDSKLRAMCGLVQLTAFAAQIIGVETFNDADMRKGYAKAVCAVALREGLREADVVTWSTNQGNVASCRTAESLGMQPYYGLFIIR